MAFVVPTVKKHEIIKLRKLERSLLISNPQFRKNGSISIFKPNNHAIDVTKNCINNLFFGDTPLLSSIKPSVKIKLDTIKNIYILLI